MDEQATVPSIAITAVAAPSQPAEPSPAQPPPSTPQLQQQEPPPTLPQPASATTPPASASAPPTPSPNPNPNPTSKPPSLLALPPSQSTAPSSTTAAAATRSSSKTPIVHRPWQHLNPHTNFTHFPSSATPPPPASASSLSSSSLSPVSAPQQRATVAIGVPAAHPSPSPSPFSSPFGQQFGGLSRSTTSLPESVASTGKSQVRPGQGVQGIGMMGSMSSSAQVRPGGISAHHQQRPVQSSIRPSSSSPSNQSPTSQNFQGHSFLRSSSVGHGSPAGPAPSTSQSIQSASQPWLSSGSQGKPPLPSPSYRPQLTSPSLQQRTYIPQQHPSLPTTPQQQQTPSPQPTQSLTTHQPPEHYGQQFPPRAQSSSHPQQVTRVQGALNQKPASPAVVQPNTVQSVMQGRTHNAESDESGNRIVGKRSIHELVTQIDPSERLDPEVEEILVDIAEEFVESITTFGCSLAKHRKSDTLEAKDILLHLERNWNMTLPGFSADEIKTYRRPLVNDIHKERRAVVKKSILASNMVNAKNSAGQAAGNMRGNLTKTPANSMLSPNLKIREVT